MKKILSFVLAAVMLSGMFSLNALSAGEDQYIKDRELLSAIGIGLDKSSESSDNISRARFVSVILDLANESAGAHYSSDEAFLDVDKDHTYYDAVNAGAALGYVVGYTNGYFYPDSPISFSQAVKVIVNVLGYENAAERAGGYPNGYMSTASSLGITKGVGMREDDELDCKSFASMLINALSVKPMKMTVGGSNRVMEAADNDALWEFHRIVKIKDVITANEVTGLTSVDNAAPKGYAVLGNEEVRTGRTAAAEYLGYSVVAYVYYDEDETDGEIKYIEPGTRNTATTVPAEDILSDDQAFSSSNFVYEDQAGRAKSVKISKDTAVIVNGAAKPIYSVKDISPDAGYVTFIDSNGDGSADCFDIFNVTKVIIVDSVSSKDDSFRITDKFDPNISYSYDTDYEYYDVKIDDEKNTYASISANMLVFIGENGSHSVTRAYADSALLQGKIDGISSENIVINGESYKISPFAENIEFPMGKTGTFWVHDGIVYAYKKGVVEIDGETVGGGEYKYGWFVDGTLYDDDDTGEPSIILRIMNDESEFIRFKTTDKTRFNGARKEDKTDAAALFRGDDGDWKQQVVMYSLDSDDKIKEVFTTDSKGKELRFEGTYDSKWHSNEYSFYVDTWQNRFYQDDDTVVFYINDTDVEQSYAAGKLPSATAIRNYVHEFYNVDEEYNTVDVVVWHRSGATSQEADKIPGGVYPTIIKSVSDGLDADDQPIKTLIGDNNGTTVTIAYNDKLIKVIRDEFNSIEAGDIVYYELDGMGRLQNIIKSFDINKLHEYGIATPNNYDRVHGIWENNIHMPRKDAYYKIDQKLSNNFYSYTDGDGVECIQKVDLAQAKFYRMTVRGRKVNIETITYDDVAAGDEVFCCFGTNRLQTMIVIDVK